MPRYIKTFKNALPRELCQKLIAKFNSDPRVEDDPQPDYSTRRFIYASDKEDWEPLTSKVTEIANQLTAQYFEYLGAGIESWFDDGFVLACYKPGDVCALHDDAQTPIEPNNNLRYATLLFYLNSVEEGETHFPSQQVKVQPEEGMAVMFPAQLTHPHEVLSPKSDRYIFQTWITNPELAVYVKDYDDA